MFEDITAEFALDVQCIDIIGIKVEINSLPYTCLRQERKSNLILACIMF